MARRNNVPKRADTEKVISGHINTGPNRGSFIIVTLYRDLCGYAKLPHRWLTLEWPDRPQNRGCWQFSGARLDEATVQFDEFAALIDTGEAH